MYISDLPGIVLYETIPFTEYSAELLSTYSVRVNFMLPSLNHIILTVALQALREGNIRLKLWDSLTMK